MNYYYDCAYMMIRSASSPTQFPPPDLQSSWTVLPIDIQNSSMNYGSGIHQVGGERGEDPILQWRAHQ